MLNHRERGMVRVGGSLVVAAAMALATVGYSVRSTKPIVRAPDVVVKSLAFKEATCPGGDMHPTELAIEFTGTPGTADVVRLRPEKNDAPGWRVADPIKDTDEKKTHYSFAKKDDTGPYVDVPLSGTSPEKVILDTANPDSDRKDTFVTAKVGDSDEIKSNKITITHDAGN